MSNVRRSSPAPARKKSKSRGMVAFYILAMVVILSMVWFSFGANVLDSPGGKTESGIPEYVGSLQLQTKSEGSTALSEINTLHGTDIKLVSGYKASYSPPYGGESVTVWVGSAASAQQAADLLERMVLGISKGTSPFSIPKQVTVFGRSAYEVEGPGGLSYFYQSRESEQDVVWLTISSKNPRSILEKAVSIF